MEFNKDTFVSAIVGALNACTYTESFYLPVVDGNMSMLYDNHEPNSIPSTRLTIDPGSLVESRAN